MRVLHPSGDNRRPATSEEGIALVIALLATLLISFSGLYLVFSSVTELRISDNYEAELQAHSAARAGINHAREALRGLDFDDQLRGPSGTYDGSPALLAQARTFAFRNPIDWAMAGSMDVLDPLGGPGVPPDQGVVNTGAAGNTPGNEIIPLSGVAFTVPDTRNGGITVAARYFVKVSDNNGEPSELAGDPADNPFFDGDGTVLVRSVGVARTIQEATGAGVLRNSLAVYEARLHRSRVFNLDSPVTLVGNQLDALFNGTGNSVTGGAGNAGLSVVDTDPSDSMDPVQILTLALNASTAITGGGIPSPSVRDVTETITAESERRYWMDPAFLADFAFTRAARWTDAGAYSGPTSWDGLSSPDLGYYDPLRPPSDPLQRPRVTFVDGSLSLNGGISGAGLLVVRGDFSVSGATAWYGLVLVIGTGKIEASGLSPGIRGGLFLASVTASGSGFAFGIPSLHLLGGSNITFDADAIKMALRLFPVNQIGFREITRSMDP